MSAGIGYAIVLILLLMNTYYNVLIAYALFYMFASITNELPWASCKNLWNTPNCIESRYGKIFAENYYKLPMLLSVNILTPVVSKNTRVFLNLIFIRGPGMLVSGIETDLFLFKCCFGYMLPLYDLYHNYP